MSENNKLAEMHVEIVANLEKYNRGLQEAKAKGKRAGEEAGDGFARGFSTRAESVSAALGSLATAATLGLTAPLLAMGGATVKLASDLEEAKRRSGVVFGDMAKQVEDYVERSANAFGMTRTAAYDAAAQFGQTLKASGLGDDVARMSTALSSLAGDLAAFNNVAPEDAVQRLFSGISGQYESLQKLGIIISDSAVKARASAIGLNGDLSEGQKRLIRYAIAMDQAKDKIGAVSEQSKSFKGVQSDLNIQVQELGVKIGKDILPLQKAFFEFLDNAITKTTKWYEDHQTLALSIGVVAIALGPGAALAKAIVGTIALVGKLREAWILAAGAASLASGAGEASALAGGASAAGIGAAGTGFALPAIALGTIAATGYLGYDAIRNRSLGMPGQRFGDKTDPALTKQILGQTGRLSNGSLYRQLPDGRFEIYRQTSVSSKAAGSPTDAFLTGAGQSVTQDVRVAIVSPFELMRLQGGGNAILAATAKAMGATGAYGGPTSKELEDAAKAMPGGRKPAKDPKAPKGSAGDDFVPFTEAVLESMAAAIRTPKLQNSCAYFASQMIEQMTGTLPQDATSRGALERFGIASAAGLEAWTKAHGSRVNGSMQPGDVVFSPGTGPSGRHVGIYDGRNIIDSSGKPASDSDGRRIRLDRAMPRGAVAYRLPNMRGMGDLGGAYDDAQAQLVALQQYEQALRDAARAAKPWLDIQEKLIQSARDENNEVAKLTSTRAVDATALDAYGKKYEDLTNGSNKLAVVFATLARLGRERAEQAKRDAEDLAAKRASSYFDDNKLGAFGADLQFYGLISMAAGSAAKGVVSQQTASKERMADHLRDLAERAAAAGGSATKAAYDFRQLAIALGYGTTEAERYATGLEAANLVTAKAADVQRLEAWRSEMDRVAWSIENMFTNVTERIYDDGFSRLFSNVLVGFRDMIVQMNREWAMSQIRNWFMRSVGGLAGALVGAAPSGSAIASGSQGTALYAPGGVVGTQALASGGPVMAGRAYIVGDGGGPEMFVPGSNGYIANSAQTRRLVGDGGITINITINGGEQGSSRANADEIAATVTDALRRFAARTG